MTALTVTVDAGPHDRIHTPCEFESKDLLPGRYDLVLEGEEPVSLQVDGAGTARTVVTRLSAGERRIGVLVGRHDHPDDQVTLTESAEGLEITAGGELLTRYVFADVPARPYFYPVLAPGGIPVTRAFPMALDFPGETRDHPHHRSLWIAHGEVNGADNWSEEPGHGATRHERFESMSGGPVAGSFTSRSLWVDTEGAPLLTQRLTVTAWAPAPDAHLLDFTVGLEATHGDVLFGDTKEGGILSVRVASELDVPRTGRITNVYGGIDEAETWGKSSHWCDYSGSIDGAPAGIAVMDHPLSFRYPTHWHVRNYGLMTANPFGYAAYTGGAKKGSYTLRSGDALNFRYRAVIHRGSCATARINSRYLDFVAPPRITITT